MLLKCVCIFLHPTQYKSLLMLIIAVFLPSPPGRGSDSESDGPPHRKTPDVRKDDMSVRRTSVTELRTPLPFNQYLPNKSNQSGYVPTPLRKKVNDKDEGGRKSWSTATSPVGGDRPCRWVFQMTSSVRIIVIQRDSRKWVRKILFRRSNEAASNVSLLFSPL